MRTTRPRKNADTLPGRERLLARLPELRQVLRGSLVTRFRRCGQARCRCARQDDPGHGPAYYLMVTVAPGKTMQVYVPKEHRKLVQAWLANFQRARKTLEDISTFNRDLLKQGRLFKGG